MSLVGVIDVLLREIIQQYFYYKFMNVENVLCDIIYYDYLAQNMPVKHAVLYHIIHSLLTFLQHTNKLGPFETQYKCTKEGILCFHFILQCYYFSIFPLYFL